METVSRPVLVVDEGRCRANIISMLERAQMAGVCFRPHFKTHQSELIGSWFRTAGIDRIAVSSVSMARTFAEDGWKDILIAFPLNFREMDDLRVLATKVRLGVLISCPEAGIMLPGRFSFPVSVYVKIDVGSQRTGFDPEEASQLLALMKKISEDPMLKIAGLLAHAGHTYHAKSIEEILQIKDDGLTALSSLKHKLHPYFPDLDISWGDTPSCSVAESFTGADEIRPGNFVFYDLMQLALGVCGREQLALSVAAPVVATHPGRRETVIYAGAVHLSKEQGLCPEGKIHYGQAVFYGPDGKIEWPEHSAYIRRISQEHGIVSWPDGIPEAVKPGSLLGIVPVHACLSVNLIREYFVV